MFFSKQFDRRRVMAKPFPEHWESILLQAVPLYRILPETDRKALLGHIQVFLAEKHFEGAAGFTITEDVRLIVAAQACILMLHRPASYFPSLTSIIMYPGEFKAQLSEIDECGVVTEGIDIRSGETWDGGSLVLSWDDVLIGCEAFDGYNVVIHEFAHQLDAEEGLTGCSNVTALTMNTWLKNLREEFCSFEVDLSYGKITFIDPYAGENIAEFFAVAAESFFECPLQLKEANGTLYSLLKGYFNQDPALYHE
jgi:hypothetical protein